MPTRRVVIDHVSVGVSDLERSTDFYTRALAPLGFSRHRAWQEGVRDVTFGLDDARDFAISLEYPVRAPVHIAFAADSRDQVDAFYAAALAAGGVDNGAPGLRPEYSSHSYGRSCSIPTGTTSRPLTTDRRLRGFGEFVTVGRPWIQDATPTQC